ncbi:MAG: tetratricopeptide repeat protein [Bacteroidales bacterium]
MKRLFLLTFVFFGCSVLTPLQRSKLISVFHLIETARYAEAKGLVEDLIEDEEFAQWPRTWYARGLLSQTAYREGMEKNDRKKYELYPEQLYVAFDSYEKAIALDPDGRLESQLAPKYILLANDFQKLGEKHFNGKDYQKAMTAFEHALAITQRSVLAIQTDTNLVYNAGLAAYESQEWDQAAKHLGRLHDDGYSSNATHLLMKAHLAKGDTLAAERALAEGIGRYEDNEDLVLLMADLLVKMNESGRALKVLDEATASDPANPVFHNTKGLIYQKTGAYNDAILAYFEANAHAPEDILTQVNIATCYYNVGVEIEENARNITNNRLVQIEKSKSEAAFESAIFWLDKAYEKEPADRDVREKIYHLYRMLRVTDKANRLESLIR